MVSAAQQAMGGSTGLGGMLANLAGFAGIKDRIASELGVNPATLDEFETEAKAMLADGKITHDEIEAEFAKLAAAKGIPQPALDMVMGMLKGGSTPAQE